METPRRDLFQFLSLAINRNESSRYTQILENGIRQVPSDFLVHKIFNFARVTNAA